jgi:hypothetical protein
MPEINLLFEFTPGGSPDQQAARLQDRLGRMEMVAEAEAVPEGSKLTGVEIAAAIGVTVLIVRGSAELVEEARKLLAALKGLLVEWHDLKQVYLDLNDRRVPIQALEEADILVLVQEI